LTNIIPTLSAFDLLFIGSFLGSVVVFLRIGYLLLRGRLPLARRLAIRWVTAAGIYFAVLLTFSIRQPMRVLPRNAPWCFDDWCISVDSVAHPPAINSIKPSGQWVVVSMTVSSRMQRRRQSEPDAFVYLLDSAGQRYEPSDVGVDALRSSGLEGKLITEFLEPGGSFQSRTAFDVPKAARRLLFVKERRSRFPGVFIIGDPVSLLHRPTVLPID
jgi:hypothetical protein